MVFRFPKDHFVIKNFHSKYWWSHNFQTYYVVWYIIYQHHDQNEVHKQWPVIQRLKSLLQFQKAGYIDHNVPFQVQILLSYKFHSNPNQVQGMLNNIHPKVLNFWYCFPFICQSKIPEKSRLIFFWLSLCKFVLYRLLIHLIVL